MTKNQYLAMSLPYNLKMMYNFKERDVVDFFGMEINEDLFHCNHEEYGWYSLSLFKPILRPMSDLTKKCLRNNSIPIIELAKLVDNGHNHLDSKIRTYQGCIYVCTEKCDDIWDVVFRINDNGLFAVNAKGTDYLTMSTQIKIFQKLVELHFDVLGLIKLEEAIDVNTLDRNPYA